MTTALLALHGGPGRRSVQPVVDRFADTYDVLAPTLPGHAGGPALVAAVTGVSVGRVMREQDRLDPR